MKLLNKIVDHCVWPPRYGRTIEVSPGVYGIEASIPEPRNICQKFNAWRYRRKYANKSVEELEDISRRAGERVGYCALILVALLMLANLVPVVAVLGFMIYNAITG